MSNTGHRYHIYYSSPAFPHCPLSHLARGFASPQWRIYSSHDETLFIKMRFSMRLTVPTAITTKAAFLSVITRLLIIIYFAFMARDLLKCLYLTIVLIFIVRLLSLLFLLFFSSYNKFIVHHLLC